MACGLGDFGCRLLAVELGELDLAVHGLAGAAGIDLQTGDAEEAPRLLQGVQPGEERLLRHPGERDLHGGVIEVAEILLQRQAIGAEHAGGFEEFLPADAEPDFFGLAGDGFEQLRGSLLAAGEGGAVFLSQPCLSAHSAPWETARFMVPRRSRSVSFSSRMAM
jgi:hypothetical protein